MSSDNTTGQLSEMSEADREKLEQFKIDIASDADLTVDIRDAANEDMQFVNVPGGMWLNFLEGDFDETRVKLELDLVSNFLQRFIGEWNQNRTGVEFKADDSKTTEDDAELLNGIYRQDFRKGSGKLATDNAVDEAATCGVGAMKLATVFEDDEDPENDNQIIEWRPIHNAYSSVIWDQSAKRIDKRDARRCNILEQFTLDSFEDQWPDRKAVSAYDPNDRRFLTVSGARKSDVFIATRYEVKTQKVDVWVYNNLLTSNVETYTKEDHDKVKDDLAKDEFKVFVRKRKIKQQTVEKTVFSGVDILEKTRRIAGKWIPVVPFYGYRAYVDGVETYRGLVRKLKDAARLFNMQVSQLAENAASTGQEVPIFAPEQMLGDDIKNLWADKNNQPYLLANPLLDQNGNIIAPGPMAYSKPAALDQSTTTLLGIVPQFVQDVTGAATSEAFNSDMSGKAIRALIKRENLNTQVVTDNISNAIVWSGSVYQSMAAEVYNSKRMMQTIAIDGTEGEAMLLEMVVDQETGMAIESNDLAGKKFQPYPDAGPQYETMAEQTVEDLKGMLETLGDSPAGQQYLPVLMATLMDNITGVGMDPLKDFNRKIMLTMGLVKPTTPEEEQLVQQAQQPQDDPQAELAEAAAQQQMAEARSLLASSEQKLADADKKRAETVQIQQETGLGDRQIQAKQQENLLTQAFSQQTPQN